MKTALHTRTALVALVVLALAILAGCADPVAPEPEPTLPVPAPVDTSPWIPAGA